MMGDLESGRQLEIANKVVAYLDDLLQKVEESIKTISDTVNRSWFEPLRKPAAVEEIAKAHNEIADLLKRTYPMILQGNQCPNSNTEKHCYDFSIFQNQAPSGSNLIR